MRQKKFSNNKDLKLKQKRFIKSLEGIGDILVFQTKQKSKNQNIIHGLNRLESIINKFFAIQKNDPDKFKKLLLNQEFFDLQHKDKKLAELWLAYNPDKYLISFSTAINQILRIHEAALEVKNDEISVSTTENLANILANLTNTPGNQIFVERLLKNFFAITKIALENKDSSMYQASFRWYIDIVFDNFNENVIFDLSYLELFDDYFFLSVKYIISQNQTNLFKNLVRSVVDGIHIPDYQGAEFLDYVYIILHKDLDKFIQMKQKFNIDNRLSELNNSKKELFSKENLEIWLNKLDELIKIIEPNLNEHEREELKESEIKFRSYLIKEFKYQNLLEIVFAIGAYCLFKEKYDFISYLWGYKQPPYSRANWIGHDIIPSDLEDVVYLYFRKAFFEKKFRYWEDHHGSDLYYIKYFLLLLIRILQNIPMDVNGKYKKIEKYSLPDFNIFRLTEIENSVDEFIKLAQNIRQSEYMLNMLGIETKNKDELFDAKLIPFLRKLKEEATKKISAKHKTGNISQRKVIEFKTDVLKNFYECASIRDLFKNYFKTYEDKTKEKIVSSQNRFGIDNVHDKAAFFDEWNVYYFGLGKNLGLGIARNEDYYLINKISENCNLIEKHEFENVLSNFDNPNDLIILANRFSLLWFSEYSKNFKPNWYTDISKLQIKAFDGWYSFRDKMIPVFHIFQPNLEKQILILDKTRIGRLVQLSPLNDGDLEDYIENIFYMNIKAFSDDEQLLNEYIKNPPDWLQMKGDAKSQLEYLLTLVRIQIFERFEYIKSESFKGYKLYIND